MTARNPVIEYIIQNQKVLLNTDFMREIWMIPDRIFSTEKSTNLEDLQFTLSTLSPLYEGKLFVSEDQFYAITSFNRIDDRSSDEKIYSVTAKPTFVPYKDDDITPLTTPQDKFILRGGEIENYPDGPDIETTLGRFIANYLFLVYPFGNRISYLNEEFTSSKLEKRIKVPLLNGVISTREVKDKYINTLSLFGQSNEMICPNISEKTITIPKHITDLREKLIKENKDALKAGDASVMSDIEQQLISAYKEHLKGDSSLHFLLKSKYFNVALKKLFLVQGMTEKFGSPGKFSFIDQPMGKGWKIEDLPDIFNEVRQGSYSRAIETANGGVIAKLILRVLQDTRITIDDCKTKRGEHVNATHDTIKDFEWNYVIEPDGSTSLISEETYSNFVGKDIIVRTPGYCQSEKGFCAKCFGRVFEVLGQKAFAPIANDFARNQTTLSLKRMHGTSHSTVDVSDINRFLVI